MSVVRNLRRKKIYPEFKQPTALCLFYDGKFDAELANLGINLIGPKHLSVREWSDNIKHPNITLIDEGSIGLYEYDFIIFNSLTVQSQYINSWPKILHLPSLVINHEPYTESGFHLRQRLSQSNSFFISTEYDNDSILYGVEENYQEEKEIDLLVAGDFQQSDYHILQQLKQAIPNLVVMGNNPGLDFCISPPSYENYKSLFSKCKVYINLVTQPIVNYEVLWTLASGGNVASLESNVINMMSKKLNLSSLSISNNLDDLVLQTNKLINVSSEDYKKVSDVFSYDSFKEQWTNLINQHCLKVFTNEPTNQFA